MGRRYARHPAVEKNPRRAGFRITCEITLGSVNVPALGLPWVGKRYFGVSGRAGSCVFSIFIRLDFIWLFGPALNIHPRMNIENRQGVLEDVGQGSPSMTWW
jgi:hypothetical protein